MTTQAEIADMEAQVAFLVRLLGDDEEAVIKQARRSTQAYGTDNSLHWPVASYNHLRELEGVRDDRVRRLYEARQYLAELKASQ